MGLVDLLKDALKGGTVFRLGFGGGHVIEVFL
jgi:hypothetical protein